MVVMHGEQWHHNNPSLLVDNLYLCAARAINSKVMLEMGITCVINATLEMPTFAYQKQECMQIAVEDRVCAKLYVYFDMVADKIHSVLGKGTVFENSSKLSQISILAFFMNFCLKIDQSGNTI